MAASIKILQIAEAIETYARFLRNLKQDSRVDLTSYDSKGYPPKEGSKIFGISSPEEIESLKSLLVSRIDRYRKELKEMLEDAVSIE